MIYRILGATALVAILSSPAMSQTPEGSPAWDAPIMQGMAAASESSPPRVSEFVGGQAEGELVATDLIGETLYAEAGGEIGTISNLLFDETGKLALVVVDFKEAGDSDKQVAFAFEALRYKSAEREIHIVAAIDSGSLEDAPAFKSLAEAAGLDDSQGAAEVEDETGNEDVPGTTPQ